jgi:hypothetical protein
LLGKRTQDHLFRTFEDFEFRATFTDRKNTPTYAAEMVKKSNWHFHAFKIRSKVCCNFGRTSQDDVVGNVSAHYIALLIFTCYTGTLHNKRKNPAQNSKSSNVRNRPGPGLNPFPQQSTLALLLMISGPWQCVLFLISRSFHDGGALNYSTAPHRSKTTLISNGVFCLLESKILSIGQTLLYSLG